MSKEQTPITAEEYFNKEYGKGHFQVVFDLNDFVSLFGLIDEFAEYREKKAVLEALEEINERFKESIMLEPARIVIETEVKPKYI